MPNVQNNERAVVKTVKEFIINEIEKDFLSDDINVSLLNSDIKEAIRSIKEKFSFGLESVHID